VDNFAPTIGPARSFPRASRRAGLISVPWWPLRRPVMPAAARGPQAKSLNSQRPAPPREDPAGSRWWAVGGRVVVGSLVGMVLILSVANVCSPERMFARTYVRW